MKVCLYTAIFGKYETLKTPVKIEGLDYICFTDNKDLRSNIWDIKCVDNPDEIPSGLFYKRIKCLSHIYLPDYDITIWLDGNFVVKDVGYVGKMLSKFKTNKLMVHRHHCLAGIYRDCIYEEAKYSRTMDKYKREKILPQINEYEHLYQYPTNNGLYQSGFLLRNNRDLDVIEFNEYWLKEINRFGRVFPQCQVSLPFTLWKVGVDFDIIEESIWDVALYDITFHGNDDKFIPAYKNS